MSGFLELDGLTKKYGQNVILDQLSLSVKEGELLVLVGPSGCGKSTVLKMIAGLDDPTGGDVRIDGQSVLGREPKDRDIAMVFQSYALYPHMNVFENMAFGLRVSRKFSEEEIRSRVREAAGALQLESFLERKPKHLSGGQRQRVALGRALVRKPKVFLFDEPLSNLDAHLRSQMRAEIRKLQQRLGVTAIYVTHDQTEATTMGDRIAVLQGGKLQQIGSPSEVYLRPANKFVAGFIGSPEMNFLPGDFAGGSSGLVAGIRPESVRIGAEGESATVDLVENLGAQNLVHLKLGKKVSVMALVPNTQAPELHSKVNVSWPAKAVRFFDSASGQAVEE